MNETGWRYPTDGEACTLTLAQFLKGEVRRGAKKNPACWYLFDCDS